MNYSAIITDMGNEKIAESLELGKPINIIEFSVGDGGGNNVVPNYSQVALVNEVWRGAISSFTRNKNEITVTAVIPSDIGGFTVREVGIIDEYNYLIAVANIPETIKEAGGNVLTELELSITIRVENTEALNFTVEQVINDYGICSTAGNQAEKSVYCKNFSLTEGSKIIVKFLNNNTSDNVKLNVNNTGEKAVYAAGKNIRGDSILSNHIYTFIYNDDTYELVGNIIDKNIDSNSKNAVENRAVAEALNETINDINNLKSKLGDYLPLSGGEITGNLLIKKSLKLDNEVNLEGIEVVEGEDDDLFSQLSISADYIVRKANNEEYKIIDTSNINNYIKTYGDATTTLSGLMSADDKLKLNSISENANNYVHPYYTSKSNGLYKITVDDKGHISEAASVLKADITALGIPSDDTTYDIATASTNGLMSADDKTKLDNISKCSSIVVAANDTSDNLKICADYICTGTSDQNTINTAIESIKDTGGKITLLSGSYNFNDYLVINYPNIILCGLGNSTVINAETPKYCIVIFGNYTTIKDIAINFTASSNSIENTVIIFNGKGGQSGWYSTLQNLNINHNNALVCCDGLFTGNSVTTNGGLGLRIENLHTVGTDTDYAFAFSRNLQGLFFGNMGNSKKVLIGSISQALNINYEFVEYE